jgi:Protein of unknown function with PCYCGC motif
MNKKILSSFAVILYVALFVVSAAAQQERQAAKDESLRRGETRATLDPDLFKDARVKSAYQVAKEIPWLLDSLMCYCFCEESFHHKSLLSCYVDDHAAG